MRTMLLAAALAACSAEDAGDMAHDTGASLVDCDGDGDPIEAQDTGEPGPDCDDLEVPYNGIDDDCDPGTPDDDLDGDGFSAVEEWGAKGIDCDDNDPSVYPQAPEHYGDGIDQDCDGEIDEGCGTQRAEFYPMSALSDEIALGQTAAIAMLTGEGGACDLEIEGMSGGIAAWYSHDMDCRGPRLSPGGSAWSWQPLWLCVEMGNGPAHVGRELTVWAVLEDGTEAGVTVEVVE